jgi:hypothetical protein
MNQIVQATLYFHEGDTTGINKRLIAFLDRHLEQLIGRASGLRFSFLLAPGTDATAKFPLLVLRSTPVRKFTGVAIETILKSFLAKRPPPHAPGADSVEGYQQSIIGATIGPDKKLKIDQDDPEEDMAGVLQKRLQEAMAARKSQDPRFGQGMDLDEQGKPATRQPAQNEHPDNIPLQPKTKAKIKAASAVEILKRSANADDNMMLDKFMDGQMSNEEY